MASSDHKSSPSTPYIDTHHASLNELSQHSFSNLEEQLQGSHSGSLAGIEDPKQHLSYMFKAGQNWICTYPGCSYQSHNKAKLTTHVRTHTGEKPYNCHVCGYKSNQSSNLNIHYKKYIPHMKW